MKNIIKITFTILAALALMLSFVSCTFESTFNPDDYVVKTIYVEYGDSLSAYYYKYADTANTAYEDYLEALRELNNMTGSMIYANKSFKVYVQK